MKGKGKWVMLLLALGLTAAGCVGPSKSSDESAVAAKDNPLIGTWKVTINPTGTQKITIEPITLGASTIWAGNTIGSVVVTDLVNKASASNQGPYSFATGNTVNLAHDHIIPGSEKVWKGNASTTVYHRGTDYTINYFVPLASGSSVVAGSQDGQLIRVPTGAIASGTTVRIEYGYRISNNQTWNGTSLTTDIMVENHLYATIEKLRSWTGQVSGKGAAGNPTLVAGTTIMQGGSTVLIAGGFAAYPLLTPQTGDSYEMPSLTPQSVAGWSTGACYNAWGNWADYGPPVSGIGGPKLEGCPYYGHPTDLQNTMYRPAWLDPVCGRVTNTYKFGGTSDTYSFFMQLTGNVEAWNPSNVAAEGGADPRFIKKNYSTWYAMMAYLVPDGAGLNNTWCNNATNNNTSKYWWAGSMVPIRPGSSNHCGTLITDPHLTAKTYFALNVGIEYADTLENLAHTFWNHYNDSGSGNYRDDNADQGIGAPYVNDAGFGLIFDPTVLAPASFGRTGHGGSTLMPSGFVPQCYTGNPLGTYCNNISTAPWNRYASWYGLAGAAADTGYIFSIEGIKATYATIAFQFFTSASSAAPYITGANQCFPGGGMPKWAGQWGMGHYDSSCNFITEGADSDLDLWLGMVVMKVRNTATPGDWSFIRFDQGDNNYLDWQWNHNTANNFPAGDGLTNDDLPAGLNDLCMDSVSGKVTCGNNGNVPLTTFIQSGHEYGNPYLPPGEKKGQSARNSNCKGVPGVGYDAWTCGGHQYVVGVVCVQ